MFDVQHTKFSGRLPVGVGVVGEGGVTKGRRGGISGPREWIDGLTLEVTRILGHAHTRRLSSSTDPGAI